MIRPLVYMVLLALSGCVSAARDAQALSDDQVRALMINDVKVTLGAKCDQPNAGAKSGATSSSRYLYCTPADISQREVDAYRLGLARRSVSDDIEDNPFSP